MSNKVLLIGEALIDLVASRPGKLSSTSAFIRKIGGAPLNVTASSTKYGADSYLFATIGKDFFGEFIIDKFKNFASTKYLKRVDAFTTLAFVSLTKDGERDFEFFRGADKELSYKDIDKKVMKESDIFVFSSATSYLDGNLKNTYYDILEYGYKNNKIIIYDPNYRGNLIKDNNQFIKMANDIIEKAKIVKLSDEEAILISGKKDMNKAIEYFSKIKNKFFFITMGKEGYIFIDKEGKHKKVESQISINSIDTTGAGDAFLGYIVGSLSKLDNKENIDSESILLISKKASIAAALSTTKKGALSSLPTINTVNSYKIK